ncbi:Calx-beta domain-containing protein [Alcanivoracaceae bacterium MT1]
MTAVTFKKREFINACTGLLALATSMLFSSQTLAATITSTFGECGLDQAITAMNNGADIGDCVNTGDAYGINDTIEISFGPGGISGVLPLNGTPLPTITQALVINAPTFNGGPGLTIDAGSVDGTGLSRILSIEGSSPSEFAVQLNNIELINGRNVSDESGGAAIFVRFADLTLNNVRMSNNTAIGPGGAIRMDGGNHLTLNNTTITDNQATGDFGRGGAVRVAGGDLTINNSTISNNQTTGTNAGGGALSLLKADATLTNVTCDGNTTSGDGSGGGCIELNEGDLTIVDSRILNNAVSGDNTAGGSARNAGGGGIFIETGALNITNSSVTGNSTDGTNAEAGGIWGRYVTALIVGSTIANNTASGGDADVGGLALGFAGNNNAATLINSTVSGNRESGDQGSGVAVDGGPITLIHSTVVNNTSAGGSAAVASDQLSIQNSLIVQDPALDSDATNPACKVAAADFTGSLATDASCGGTGVTPAEIDLQALADNGGQTQTYALGEGSIAIDAADQTICGSLPDTDTRSAAPIDQREESRLQGTACDVGAFESEGESMPGAGTLLQFDVATTSVNEAEDSVTLTVTRTGSADGSVSVTYTTASGSAEEDVDFTPATGTLSWADGDTEPKTFSVTILDDSEDEDDETFTATLSTPTNGAALGDPKQVEITLVDDDQSSGGGSSGGGGVIGLWPLLLLGVSALRRRPARRGNTW